MFHLFFKFISEVASKQAFFWYSVQSRIKTLVSSSKKLATIAIIFDRTLCRRFALTKGEHAKR